MILKNIKRLCKERGICIKALEQATGIGNGVIARWVTSAPRVDSLKKVADYFGVTVDELMKDEAEPR